MHSSKHPPFTLILALLTHLQSLQPRLVILLTIQLMIVGLMLGLGLIWPDQGTTRLWVGGGMFVVGAVLAWLMIRMVRHDLIRPLQQFQAELTRPEQDVGGQEDQPVDTGNHHLYQGPNRSATAEPSLEPTEPDGLASDLVDIKEKFRQLFEVDYERIIIHQKVNILAVNQALVPMVGYSYAEIIGLNLLELMAPESRSVVLRNTLAKAEKPYQAIALRKDGSTFPVEMVGMVISGQQGIAALAIRELDEHRLADVLIALQKTKNELETKVHENTQELRYANERLQLELSERKRAEAEMINRNRELTILQAAGVAITSSLDMRYVLDTVTQEMTNLLGMESCTISEWNQTENTISTMARYDSNGWWDANSPATVCRLADYPVTREVLEEQISEQMTISQPHLDPAEFASMQKANICTRLLLPMTFKGQVIGLVGLEDSRVERIFTTQEISLAQLLANQAASAIENARLYERLAEERALLAQRVEERTEELSRANAELARAARLKDEFLAGMSHELRTPLNAILGSAEILQKEVFGPLTEKQLKYSRNIEESGQHLLSLINDILDLSKIEAGKMEISLGPVSVGVVCEASLRIIKQVAHKKQLKISHKFDEAVTILQADERRLKQILVNLLSNAVKFTPEGGEIGLEVVGDEDQQAVHFTVWDTGIGIAPEDMRRLFQPFVQLDSSLSRQYAGTGLGLSLVSRMIELHGGGVSVESQVDRGSRFTVSLPWSQLIQSNGSPGDGKPAEANQPAKIENLKHRDAQPRILLAEDNEDNINLFQDYLQVQGFQVVVARNGSEAIERAQGEQPDLILMDLQMPGMDGLEATRRLRANSAFAQTPIITLTALAMPGDRERCLAAGATEYLSKPVNLGLLVKTINAYLN
jgi:PAS domain S-box-containing protein